MYILYNIYTQRTHSSFLFLSFFITSLYRNYYHYIYIFIYIQQFFLSLSLSLSLSYNLPSTLFLFLSFFYLSLFFFLIYFVLFYFKSIIILVQLLHQNQKDHLLHHYPSSWVVSSLCLNYYLYWLMVRFGMNSSLL